MTPWFTLFLSSVLSIALTLTIGGQTALAQQSQATTGASSTASQGSILLKNLRTQEAPVSQSDRQNRQERLARPSRPTRSTPSQTPLRSRRRSPQPTGRLGVLTEGLDSSGSQSRRSRVTGAVTPTLRSSSADGHEDLDALLWLRTSPEFDALTRQTFAAATYQLGQALVDPDWNAQVPAERNSASASTGPLPTCVILDVDETVLDNSLYQLELIRDDGQFDPKRWNEFVDRRVSTVVEGAAEFLQACRSADVKVFFVTNRDAAVEAATRENLISQKLMTSTDPDRILSKGEFPDWTSDKTSRRQAVAQKYRVLLLVGDDLNDFVSAKNLTVDQRQQLYNRYQNNWGRSWFVLPNPNYGGWEQATYQNQNGATIEQKRALKRQTLLDPAGTR